jgi:hypothetical protein
MKGVPSSTRETHSNNNDDQDELLGKNDAKIVHVFRTREDGITEANIQSKDYALMIASFLWYKLKEGDKGWAKNMVFPMWIIEAIQRITQFNSSLNVGTQICLGAIAQGHQKPYAEEIINTLLKGTKAEGQYDHVYKK